MTKAHSEPGDNGGLCEGCNDPATKHQAQTAYPIELGGGLGRGTLWLCSKCLSQRRSRDEGATLDKLLQRAATSDLTPRDVDTLRERRDGVPRLVAKVRELHQALAALVVAVDRHYPEACIGDPALERAEEIVEKPK